MKIRHAVCAVARACRSNRSCHSSKDIILLACVWCTQALGIGLGIGAAKCNAQQRDLLPTMGHTHIGTQQMHRTECA